MSAGSRYFSLYICPFLGQRESTNVRRLPRFQNKPAMVVETCQGLGMLNTVMVSDIFCPWEQQPQRYRGHGCGFGPVLLSMRVTALFPGVSFYQE